MKITDIRYDAGTISAPAFIDIFVENGDQYTFKGKTAKRLSKQFKIGDEFPVQE